MPARHQPAEPETAHQREPVGTFVKPGPDGEPVERVAWSPSHAVALTFDGWRPQSTTAEPTTPDAAGSPRESPRSGTSPKSR